MITWIGLVVLVCLVWGSVTLYQAEENDNITVTLDIQTKRSLSAAFLECVFRSDPVKIVYYMVKGNEVPKPQHPQFAGRVQCDRDALREGRIKLHLSTVAAGDSGLYRCKLAVGYDNAKRRWAFENSDYFVLNVTRTSAGENRKGSINTPHQAGVKRPPGCTTQGGTCCTTTRVGPFLAAVTLLLLVLYVLFKAVGRRRLPAFVEHFLQ